MLSTPDVEWFTTAADKAAYLTRLTASTLGAMQQTSPPEGDSTRTVALRGTLPIGMESDGRTVLIYLATEVSTDAYQTVIHEELESPLQTATIAELKRSFEHHDKATREPMHPEDGRFVDAGAKGFATPRFSALYQRWLKSGDAVLEGQSSPVIAEALITGAGRVESLVLSHSYRHLSPLVDQRRSRARDVENGVEKGAASARLPQTRNSS